jgi:hypothetical protein
VTQNKQDAVDTLIAQWRLAADEAHPAGPLFAGGEYAESDIVGDVGVTFTYQCGTGCSASRTRYCC